jgi:hypothetical protein
MIGGAAIVTGSGLYLLGQEASRRPSRAAPAATRPVA